MTNQPTEQTDMRVCAEVLRDMVTALNTLPRSRYLALAITELEMAQHWLHDAVPPMPVDQHTVHP